MRAWRDIAINTAGIDVAQKTLALAVSTKEKLGKVREFAKTPSGHAALIKALHGAQVETDRKSKPP